MAAQKRKKKLLAEVFLIFEHLLTQSQLIKIHNVLDSSRPYGRLLENKKSGGSRELFLPENDFQTSSTVNFPKKPTRFWRPGNLPKT